MSILRAKKKKKMADTLPILMKTVPGQKIYSIRKEASWKVRLSSFFKGKSYNIETHKSLYVYLSFEYVPSTPSWIGT